MVAINGDNAAEAAKAVRNGAHHPEPSAGTVRRSPTIGALASSLAKAQAEMKNPPKDSINPHFKNKYADLATVRDTVLPVLAKNNLSVVQLPCDVDGLPALTTILMHTSGEYIETTALTRPTKMDPQGIGSAMTYARRYGLQSIVGVAADDDDDGHAGSRPAERQQSAPARGQTQQPAAPDALEVAKLTQQFAQCNDDAAWSKACDAVKAAAGKLTPAGLEHVRGVAKETQERIKSGAA
jgi:hypothetical protein